LPRQEPLGPLELARSAREKRLVRAEDVFEKGEDRFDRIEVAGFRADRDPDGALDRHLGFEDANEAWNAGGDEGREHGDADAGKGGAALGDDAIAVEFDLGAEHRLVE